MPKLSKNAFIDKHKQGVCVVFDFADLRRVKSRSKKATAGKPSKPSYTRIKLFEKATGKEFPSPNQIIAALARTSLKSDYYIESDVAGTVQGVIIADAKEAAALVAKFPHGEAKRGDGKPIKAVVSAVVDVKKAEALAREFKLL